MLNTYARIPVPGLIAQYNDREDIVDGLEKPPEAFIGRLDGGIFGKLIVRV